ncbi:uncharacterized protein LOC112184856 [Rosa chinensis]|uniref:uncharacterized protein LOC112184856 n=1 Tax=Rosa chinensis TaxID=74649 RepID=UPI001AD8A801|nr:uncharacterized protein LOC112184856 [Rosa chinensis]
MDREWVFLDRDCDEYEQGRDAFINYSLQYSSFPDKIKCPCRKCRNRWAMAVEIVKDHIYVDGFDPVYVNLPWVEHGEQLPQLEAINIAAPFEPQHPTIVGDIPDMLHDAFGIHDNDYVPDIEVDDFSNEDPCLTPDAAKFYKLMSEADMDLFPGARKKMIDFLVRYYQLKSLHGWSDVSFTEALKLLKASFPESENLPASFYKTKKLVKDLGLLYEKIDACPNDCMLFWKEHFAETICSICGASRYNPRPTEDGATGKLRSAKVLPYFPLGPRLQRLYMSRHTSESMTWHSTKRTKDGKLRHPADSPAWSKLDEMYPNFGNESRNVRLGLASDGFNPFGNMSTSHSTWPVVMTVYNLPPWLCMKQPYIMLSLLIPGPKGPGNDIDIYLQPLVEELKNLWHEGIKTYDAFTNSTFTMRAAVLWTISDFPAYAMLSGYSTKGYKACPICMEETDSTRLHNGKKECFMGHRRWLDEDHQYRGWRNNFNGFPEHRDRPKLMTGSDCLRDISGLKFQYGKGTKSPLTRKRSRSKGVPEPYKGNWRKISIFFDLPYWEHLLLRHNLDVMHIEKNVTDSVVGTLLGMKWKNKDSAKAREDMVLLNVKHGLHPITPGGYPPAIFNLKNVEKSTICKVLASIHPPDGFSSNVSNCVRIEERTLVGLKSHDSHILMQYLFPIAIRRAISHKVLVTVLLKLSSFFKHLCSKVGSVEYFTNLSSEIAITLCTLESIMPPAFFDIMEHLPIHLADEAAIAGPVHYRWMYPIERYNHSTI